MKVDPSIFVKKKREVDWSMVNLPSYSRVGADVDSAAVHQKQRTRVACDGLHRRRSVWRNDEVLEGGKLTPRRK